MLATAFASALDLLAAARGASAAPLPDSRKALASEMYEALDLGLLAEANERWGCRFLIPTAVLYLGF